MKKLFLILTMLLALVSQAAHLVGGEISYECTGNNNYLITLKVYRDCNSTGAPFDPNAYIAVFNGTNGLEYTSVSPIPTNIIQLPTTVSNPCLQTPPNICTEMATYTASVYLPPASGGYVITYQRCCRNQTISNIPNPGTWGSTYSIRIPPNDTSCNSSPNIAANPPIVLCLNDTLNISSAAVESDGDSLYYQLCSPKHGGSQAVPRPSPPASPPYQNIPFGVGYSSTFPIPGTPPFQIDGQTGLITGKPNQVGQFVVAICVSEYKNGALLSTLRRDYQFNVTNCQSNVSANFNSNTLYCTGRTVTFTNNSLNGTNYLWDFGVPSTLADTSGQTSPTFIFPDTGVYTVQLIVNPGWPCTDTIERTVEVRYPANAAFTYSGSLCLDGSQIIFNTTSNNTTKDIYQWDFGPNAIPTTSNLRNPPPVLFTTAGSHPIRLRVSSYGCMKTVFDTVKVYEVPSIDFDVPDQVGCAPFTVNFNDGSTASTNILYEWDFGDGNSSSAASPTHTYTNLGVYDVTLTIFVIEGCTDTLQLFKPGLITVNPTPTSSVKISPRITTIYDAVIEVEDLMAVPGETFYTDMGDGKVYNNQKSFYHQYIDTGTYVVRHVVGNQFNCADTAEVIVRINPEPLVFAPNAFSPNNDGDNDVYQPSIVGSKEYRIVIYSRWGDLVFESENPSEGWNGLKFNTGGALPVGVYTYAIYVRDINNGIIEKKGYITLIR